MTRSLQDRASMRLRGTALRRIRSAPRRVAPGKGRGGQIETRDVIRWLQRERAEFVPSADGGGRAEIGAKPTESVCAERDGLGLAAMGLTAVCVGLSRLIGPAAELALSPRSSGRDSRLQTEKSFRSAHRRHTEPAGSGIYFTNKNRPLAGQIGASVSTLAKRRHR
jgi:hypothetical protein